MTTLNVDELLETARQRTSLTDFGPADFMEGLVVLVSGINAEVKVAPDRAKDLRERFVRLLMNRLWFAKDLKDHPEILDQDVGSPIVITSLPRTASTKLHRMLGASGDFQVAPMWQTHMFARIPGLDDGGRARRIQETRVYEKWMYEVSPALITGHPMFTDEPEEDKDLGEFTFRHTTLLGMFGSLAYAGWVMQADMAPMYDYLLMQLQYLQWQTGGAGKPWLLKTPCHFGNEAHLCRIFDQPRFIVTHRDPVKCIPSICTASLAARKLYSDDSSSEDLGASVTALFAHSAREHMKWRDENPGLQILDLSFDEINADGLGAARKIYDYFGMQLSEKAQSEIVTWEKNNNRDRHAKSIYSTAAIGTTDDAMRQTFAPYSERYAKFIY